MTSEQVPFPRTAIVPAAGLGTRFLPATKTVPKELLPVVDTPGIELVAEEAADAGAERLVIVTSEGKDGVVAHFVEDLVLEGTLEARGKKAMLAKVRRAPALIKVESVVQAEPLGWATRWVVWNRCSRRTRTPWPSCCPMTWCSRSACWKPWRRCGPNAAARCCAPSRWSPHEVSAYGVFDVEIVPDAVNPNVLRVKGMVEKPAPDKAPSRYAAAGRYLLDRAIFDALRRVERGRGRGDPAHRCRRPADRRRPPGARRGASRVSTRLGKSRRVSQGCG